MKRLATMSLAVLTLVAVKAGAADDEPLPAELLTAKTVFVKQTLIDPKIVSRFRSELAKWDRLEVVATEEDADIIATLKAQIDYTPTVADSASTEDEDTPNSSGRSGDTGPRPIGTVRVLEDIHLIITLPDGTEVWKDAVPAGTMLGNASRKLAKRLQKRIDEQAS